MGAGAAKLNALNAGLTVLKNDLKELEGLGPKLDGVLSQTDSLSDVTKKVDNLCLILR